MSQKLVRETIRVLNVLVAVVVSATWGGSAGGQVLAASVAALVALSVEGALVWAPRHFHFARILLDPRAVWLGTWVQTMTNPWAPGGSRPETGNRFGFFRVFYDDDEGSYAVSGLAFDAAGRPFATWRSTPPLKVVMSTRGRRMSYQFLGGVLREGQSSSGRRGLTYLVLRDGDVAGEGSVEHVADRLSFDFDVHRLTDDWLALHHVTDRTSTDFEDDDALRALARRVAPTLPTLGAAGPAAGSVRHPGTSEAPRPRRT